MQTVIVVETRGIIPAESREAFRRKLMKDMSEGLIVVDESITITTHNIQDEVGIEFNVV